VEAMKRLRGRVYVQNDGVTALHISVMTGDEAMVKLLHSFKASASIPDKVPAPRNTSTICCHHHHHHQSSITLFIANTNHFSSPNRAVSSFPVLFRFRPFMHILR